jgi:hypothetical protein
VKREHKNQLPKPVPGIGDRTVDLVIYRRAGKVAVAVARNEGGVQVQIVP